MEQYTSVPTKAPGTPETKTYDFQSLKQNSDNGETHDQRSMLFSRRSLWQVWWLEILCCLVAVAAVFAIFGTIYPYANQTLPQWPYGLSINSLISIYIVILKAALWVVIGQGISQLKWTWFNQVRPLKDLETYDSASRGGIFGTTALLWRLRGRQLVTSVGALIMLISLITDPIAQQLIHYRQCRQLVPNIQATVSRSNVYNLGGGATLRVGNIEKTVPPALQSAINAGVYSPESITIPFDCLTGNCTISDEYSSVGYCSGCSDVTDQLTVHHFNQSGGMETYTLPSGLTASPGPATFIMGVNNSGVIELIYTNLETSLHCSNNTWPCRGYGAARCSLFPCTKTYRSAIEGGKLSESLISTSTEWGPSTSNLYRSSVKMSCVTDEQKQSLRKIGYTFDDKTEWLPYNVSYDPTQTEGGARVWAWANDGTDDIPSNATLQIIPPKCIYQEGVVSDQSFSGFFESFFNGSMAVGPGTAGSKSSVVETFYGDGDHVTFQRVSDIFNNVSHAMTAAMRVNGVDGRSDPAVGVVYRDETCVGVTWEWVIFPAGLVVLTLLFFVAMVAQTTPKEQSGVHDYKSSTLALMFHGLDRDVEDRGGRDSGRVSILEKEARDMYVRLSATDKGWKFVEARGVQI